MNIIDFNLNDEVIMKKQHACGTNLWTITRNGADIKLRSATTVVEKYLWIRLEFMRKLKKGD